MKCLVLFIYNKLIFSLFYHIFNMKIISVFSILNKKYIFLLKKHNGFQYSFVTTHHLCLIIISAILVQIVTSEENKNRILMLKVHLPTTIATFWIPELFQPQMGKFTLWKSKVPVIGAQFRVHVLGSKILF